MSKKSFLDRIEIPKPCLAEWERMVGTVQIRFCEECNKHVYNLSGMTRGEAEALIVSAPKGRLCARLTRKADGTTVTIDNQPGVQLIWRRTSPIANAVVSAMLTMAMPVMAGATQIETQRASIASAIAGPDERPDSQGTAGIVSGTLFDAEQAVVVGGKIDLVNEDTGEVQTTTSSGDGSFQFVVSSSNLYTLRAAANGFASVATSGLRPGQHIDIKLAPAVMGGAMQIPVRTLRELYNDSDRIVVARAGRSLKIRESYLIRTSLSVSSTLKGEGSEPVVNLYHFAYSDQQDSFPQNESFLVFLKHRGADGASTPGGGYELVDFSRGLKKLSSADLDVYVKRIKELAQLSLVQKPDQEELVEWLVRCAENPATRWEGAWDLALSAGDLRESCAEDDSDEDTEESDSSEEPDEEKGGEAVEADSTEEPMPYAGELGEQATFAALLTADQKARLMNALLNTEEMTEGDEKLIELVKDFHDPRLLPFLAFWLRRTEDNPPEAARTVVRVIAELMSDKRITALAERYKDAPDDDEDEQGTNEDTDTAKTQSAPARERSAQIRLFLQQVERSMRGRNLEPPKQWLHGGPNGADRRFNRR